MENIILCCQCFVEEFTDNNLRTLITLIGQFIEVSGITLLFIYGNSPQLKPPTTKKEDNSDIDFPKEIREWKISIFMYRLGFGLVIIGFAVQFLIVFNQFNNN